MSKVIIVTPSADKNLIRQYATYPMIGVEKGADLILNEKLTPLYAIGDFDSYQKRFLLSRMNEKNIITLSQDKDESDTEGALMFALDRFGYNDVVILASLHGRYDHSHALLLLLKKYHKIHLQIEDAQNRLLYFEKGSHVVMQDDYTYVGLFGFPSAVVTMENTKYPVHKLKLNFCEVKAISNVMKTKASLFIVHKGSVLLVLSKDQEE